MVLFSALTMDANAWMFQFPAFSQKYRVVAFDNRGTGRSDSPHTPYTTKDMADDVAGLMDTLNIRKAHIVSMSLGSLAAQEFAIKYPERTTSLVLAATAAYPSNNAHYARHVAQTLVKVHEERTSLETIVKLFMAWCFTERFFEDPDRVAMVVNMMLANPTPQPRHGFAGQIGAGMQHDTRASLGKISAPTLVIAGRQDLLFHEKLCQEVFEAIPNAEMTVIEGSHLLNFENPEAFNDAVLTFLSKRGM
jgi:pimeloyl-ACP methyl ester carboxylesterase